MLASDLNNPEFTNPQNPDQFLSVEFAWHTPLDQNKTEKASADAGRYVPVYGEKQVYVRIQRPGDLTSVVHEKLREDHKRRWPDKWRYFQIQEGLINEDIPGWKLDEWNELNPEEIARLKFLRFNTVEQIAGASDAQCQGIGMGAEGLRIRAREAIKNRGKVEVTKELQEKEKQIAELKERMERLESALLQNAAPQSNNESSSGSPDASPAASAPKKRGRPKKVQPEQAA